MVDGVSPPPSPCSKLSELSNVESEVSAIIASSAGHCRNVAGEAEARRAGRSSRRGRRGTEGRRRRRRNKEIAQAVGETMDCARLPAATAAKWKECRFLCARDSGATERHARSAGGRLCRQGRGVHGLRRVLVHRAFGRRRHRGLR